MTEEKYDTKPIHAVLAKGDYLDLYLPKLLPGLIAAKNQAHHDLTVARWKLRPMNNGVLKATEADRNAEVEGRTADLKREYQNLADLYDLCMVLVGK